MIIWRTAFKAQVICSHICNNRLFKLFYWLMGWFYLNHRKIGNRDRQWLNKRKRDRQRSLLFANCSIPMSLYQPRFGRAETRSLELSLRTWLWQRLENWSHHFCFVGWILTRDWNQEWIGTWIVVMACDYADLSLLWSIAQEIKLSC